MVPNVPKYSTLAETLVTRIRSGVYKPGELLDSEPELTRQFGVSRHTVRAALRSLYEKGLVVSQRGRGTVVQATAINPRYRHSCDSIEDVLQYAATTPRHVQARRRIVVDNELAGWLGCAPGYPWWEIHTTRRLDADGPVIASSLIWVPDAFEEAVRDLEAGDEPLFVAIERRFGCNFAQIRQAISIASASAREATDLGLEPGAPVMCVERRFVDERGGLLDASRSVHPAQGFRYETSLRRVIGA
jgi:GntR family transcriptional regulator